MVTTPWNIHVAIGSLEPRLFHRRKSLRAWCTPGGGGGGGLDNMYSRFVAIYRVDI